MRCVITRIRAGISCERCKDAVVGDRDRIRRRSLILQFATTVRPVVDSIAPSHKARIAMQCDNLAPVLKVKEGFLQGGLHCQVADDLRLG